MRAILSIIFIVMPLRAFSQDRDFLTDRPGPTDSPKTMTEGRYRVEASAVSAERSTGKQVDDKNWSYGSFYLVRGMSASSELQFGVDGYKVNDDGQTTERGFGASSLRYKFNLLGNDSGSFALGIIPKIVYTGELGGNQWTGGLNLPMAFELSDKLNLAVMAQWDYLKSEPEDGESQYTVPLVLGYELTDRICTFVQYTGTFDEGWELSSFSGFGGSYQLLPTVILDAEFGYGNNQSVETIKFTLGASYGF